jgi:glycosyltransferase involved in cell wall biosynthesis
VSAPSIEWRGRLGGRNGLALEAAGFIRALRAAGFSVREVPVDSTPVPTRRNADAEGPAPDLTVLHLPRHDLGWDNLAGKTVWRAMFETASIPPSWLDRLPEVTEVWVPSTFNARTFASAGVPAEKIRVVSEAVDVSWLARSGPCHNGNGPFRFLSVFRWQQRKGWDVLLRAYLSEFTAADNTELVIRADPMGPVAHDIPADIAAVVRQTARQSRSRNLPRITYLPRSLPFRELSDLYASSHAFVLPTRGEAWGRPYMEAMAAGLVTIGTGWGGQRDFMDSTNSLLIDYHLVPVSGQAVAEWPNFKDQLWAEPSVPSLRSCMRRAYEGGPQMERLRGNAVQTVRKRLSASTMNEHFLSEVRRLVALQPGS